MKAVKEKASQQSLGLGPTLPRLVAIYEEQYLTRRRPRTQSSERSVLRAALEALPERPTAGDFIAYFNGRLAAAEITESTAAQHQKILRRVYEFGRNFFAVIDSPWRSIPRIQPQLQRPRALVDPLRSYPRILAALPTEKARAFVSIQRRMGLRFGEVLGLEPRHIAWDRGELRIEQQRQPTRAGAEPLKSDASAASLPLHPECAELLRAAARQRMGQPARAGRARERYLFPYYADATARLLEVCRSASPESFPRRAVGVSGGVGWHAFRHTFGTELVEAGVPMEKLQLFLRHKSIQTTQTYVASIRGRVVDHDALKSAWATVAEAEALAAQPAAGGLVVFPFGEREDHGSSSGAVLAAPGERL